MKVYKNGREYEAWRYEEPLPAKGLPAWLKDRVEAGRSPLSNARGLFVAIGKTTEVEFAAPGDWIVCEDDAPCAVITDKEAQQRAKREGGELPPATSSGSVGGEISAARWPAYRSHKVVRAAEILDVAGARVTLEAGVSVVSHDLDEKMFARYMPTKGDYLVAYEDGYLSFSPRAAFEEGYHKLAPTPDDVDIPIPGAQRVAGNGIGWAIKQMQFGSRVRRRGWNGKGMFVVLMPELHLPPFNTQGTDRKVNDRTAKWIGEDQPLNCRPYIAMYNAQKEWQPGWLASQADLLAMDWELAD